MVLEPMVENNNNGVKCVMSYWKQLFMDQLGYMIQTLVSDILKYGLLYDSKHLRKETIPFLNTK